MKLLKELNEGVMDLSVGGSDSAADAWYVVQKAMMKAAVPALRAELKDKGNEFNTPGPLNVAMIITEKFKDLDVEESPELSKLIDEVISKLEAKDAPWRTERGYSKILSKLKSMR